jgi:hypothetical protein
VIHTCGLSEQEQTYARTSEHAQNVTHAGTRTSPLASSNTSPLASFPMGPLWGPHVWATRVSEKHIGVYVVIILVHTLSTFGVHSEHPRSSFELNVVSIIIIPQDP